MSHNIRNVEICRLIEQGVPYSEIANQFNLSESTVRRMKYTICRELEVTPKEALHVASNTAQKLQELESRLFGLEERFRHTSESIRREIDERITSALTTVKEELDRYSERLNQLESKLEEITKFLEEMKVSMKPPIEVSKVEVSEIPIPRRVNLSPKVIMLYTYVRSQMKARYGRDLDLSDFINESILAFFEKCIGLNLAVVKKEIGESIPEQEQVVEVNPSEGGSHAP